MGSREQKAQKPLLFPTLLFHFPNSLSFHFPFLSCCCCCSSSVTWSPTNLQAETKGFKVRPYHSVSIIHSLRFPFFHKFRVLLSPITCWWLWTWLTKFRDFSYLLDLVMNMQFGTVGFLLWSSSEYPRFIALQGAFFFTSSYCVRDRHCSRGLNSDNLKGDCIRDDGFW